MIGFRIWAYCTGGAVAMSRWPHFRACWDQPSRLQGEAPPHRQGQDVGEAFGDLWQHHRRPTRLWRRRAISGQGCRNAWYGAGTGRIPTRHATGRRAAVRPDNAVGA
jgi:hypothetical protein